LDVYVIRHAEAYRQGERGVTTDEERPLTEDGERQATQVGADLHRRGVRPAIVLTSPLLRARQTADLVASQLPSPAPEVHVLKELTPGSKRRKLARAVDGLAKEQVFLVGHQPDLGEWIAWLMGSKKAKLELAKAGVARLHCEGPLEKGSSTLVWLLPPAWVNEGA
jgi:phosphohistidine phosphatase